VIVAYGVWLAVMLVMMLRAVAHQEAETPQCDEDLGLERRLALVEAELQAIRADRAESRDV
jgi:hypothetical protein